jgi:hypothetical protein
MNATPSRRSFLDLTVRTLGGAAAASLLTAGPRKSFAAAAAAPHVPGPHFPGKAKHVIYLHMVGGPSQMDLYDYKPKMDAMYDKDLPDSIRNGQRLTGMTSGQARFPVAPSMYKFKQHGKCGMWVSELLPNTAKVVDEMCFIRSMNTDAINHEPAITFAQTGNQVAGRPCLGSWVSYALGTLNQNLPAFVVMVAQSTNREQLQAISAKLWTSGYLPGEHAGVSFRTTGDPILYINNPPGVPSDVRRMTLDGIRSLNELEFHELNDPDTITRTKQYELALRMQDSVPELVDLAKEPKTTWELYGEDAKKPGTFANSALQARRMVERGVRFVQIYHNNWDEHQNMAGRLPMQTKDVDRACYGLITDLKQRGMLKDTLVIWGGEFGRTIYSQGGLSRKNYGRDHHPRCYTMWMCGGGAKAGEIYGETDDFSYNIVKDPVKVHDFHATILHLLGFDHERLTFRYQGLDQKLTGVEPSRVVKDLLA